MTDKSDDKSQFLIENKKGNLIDQAAVNVFSRTAIDSSTKNEEKRCAHMRVRVHAISRL